tara:strand:+ start:783 stop:1775 length:993 start_codon:yes stop_codon:yes gene_type:complete
MKNYNLIQKILHNIVFKNKIINKSLYELEKFFYLKKINTNEYPHIFITGLPRSGTTILLNFIFETDNFASLKYENMPFILSPNFSTFLNKRNIKKKKRLHLDDITYDLKSPEAFDEVFYSTFLDDEKVIKEELKNFIELILISQKKKRYLSKNNLNYSRINLINSIIPNSIFLITIRDPLEHAYSLLKQHKHFKNIQKEDAFVKSYMNYLGHQEFGLNHKSWHKPEKFSDTNSINYWLEQWYLFYNKIFNKYKETKSCSVLFYENFSDEDFIKKINNHICLKKKSKNNFFVFKNNKRKYFNSEHDKELYNLSLNIYKKFKSSNLNNMNFK